MALAKNGDTVRVHYRVRLKDDSVFADSRSNEPMQVRLGKGEKHARFEQAIVGMSAGERKTVKIPVDEAFGRHRPEKVFSIKKAQFPHDLILEIGKRVGIRQSDGNMLQGIVTAISDSKVTVDTNHALVGHDVTIDVELVEIV